MSRYQHDTQIKNYRKQNFFYMFIVKNSCFLSHFGTQNVRTETIYLNIIPMLKSNPLLIKVATFGIYGRSACWAGKGVRV